MVVDSAHLILSSAVVLVVLGVAIAANWRRAGFLDALLAAGGDAVAIEAVLGRYVAEPTLRLRFCTEEGWMDAAGRPVAHASPSAGRVFRPIVVEPAGPAVVADLDAGVDSESRAVGSLLDAAGVVLARARLSVQQAAQAVELRASRARIVEAGVQQRRQLERDLHDGAQPRLVNLAMTLGMARNKLDTDPAAARAMIEEAHAEAKAAVTDLRQIARGIHPAVLSDRGLDAALSALAAQSPIPVDVRVTLPDRLPRATEAVAYFVVAEALTNVAKHSRATSAQVVVSQLGDRVRITVFDNGVGGAHIATGTGSTGLAGMHERVRSAQGTLSIQSPDGGPTLLTVELPCAS